MDAQVLVATDRFDADFAALTGEFGFRVDAIFPADDPHTAVISAHGVRLRLVETVEPNPVTIVLLTDDDSATARILPGGSRIIIEPRDTNYVLPDNQPSLVVTHPGDEPAPGRAGMLYRDLLPDRWGGRFIASHISIPDGGEVPDYVHFHKVRFQLIFVKSGWVRLVYEDQGEPFVMHAGDAVLQPPQIRHRVLEASPGLEVIEVGTPAEHETIADWSLALPNGVGDPDRLWDGQRFVRHIAEGSPYRPWRFDGWEYRDTGIGDATTDLAGVRIARPSSAVAPAAPAPYSFDTEFSQLVALSGAVTLVARMPDGDVEHRLEAGASVAIPGGVEYALADPTRNCELLDITLPATIDQPGQLASAAAPNS